MLMRELNWETQATADALAEAVRRGSGPAAGSALSGLRLVHELHVGANCLEYYAVREARECGFAWGVIAEVLGKSESEVRGRHSRPRLS